MTHEFLEVTAPIVGFEFSQTDEELTSLQLVMNSCSLHSHAAFELDLGGIPEPIMLEISDLNESFPPYTRSIELPEHPEIFTHAEYGNDIGRVKCMYQLAGSALTPEIPSYIKISSQGNT